MATPLHEIEHRWGQRSPIDLPVRIAVTGRSGIDGRMKNLSLSGALIEADFSVRPHSLVHISLRLPTASQYEAVLQAHVTRHGNAEFGVEWSEFGPRVVKELLRSLVGRR